MAIKKLPRYIQHFFVKGKFLGTAERYHIQVHEESREPGSNIYYCPVCGEVWAQFPVVDKLTGEASRFLALARKCEKHGAAFGEIPGQLSLNWDPEFNNSFPDEAVRYEFNQHMKYYKEEE